MGRRRAGLVFGVWVLLVFVAVFGVVLNVPVVWGSGTIYIRADGSIDPPTTPISTVDNITYTFTGNIYDSIVVERSNITIDGDGYTLAGGYWGGTGLRLSDIKGVTIKRINIEGFSAAITLDLSSSYNNISANNIKNNEFGIAISYSSHNIISSNNITDNTYHGIQLYSSSNNIISSNYIANHGWLGFGIGLYVSCDNNLVLENNITNNSFYGIYILESKNNVFKNNIMAGNLYNFVVDGGELSHFIQAVDSSNTINDKPIYYLVNHQNEQVPSDAGYVALINSTNITVKGLELKGGNREGMLLVNTTNSQIADSRITNFQAGILLSSSSNNNIFGNNITNNEAGIEIAGYSFYNVVFENNITNNLGGVGLSGSSNNNTIFRNSITANWQGNYGRGVYIYSASYNIVYENNITNNRLGVEISLGASFNTISGNKITNNMVGATFSWSPSHNTLSGNNIANNGYGIAFTESSDANVISRNNITDNYIGIGSDYSSNKYNIISENNIINNGYRGVELWGGASGNKFYHNNFINNTDYQAFANAGPNIWDDDYPSGGNYWSDYAGVDEMSGPNQDQLGSDGIGDTPYVAGQVIDRYPLMSPYVSDISPPITNHDYDDLWHTTDFTITLTATDDLSGVAETYYRINDGPIQNVSAHGHPFITTEGADNTLEYWSVDNAGNEELPHKILTGIKLDKTAPTGSIIINNDATYTTSTSVTLTLTASDATSGVYQMRFSNDGTTWTDWEAYTTPKSWTLPPGDGTKTVYYQIKDVAGLVSITYSDTIVLDTTSPSGSITINDGAAYTTTTTVTLTLSATDETSGIAEMRFSNDNVTWSDWEPYTTSKSWTLLTGDGLKGVTVQYKDNAGLILAYSDSIILDTAKPTANAGSDQTVNEDTLVTFDASASQDENGIATYTWTFTDITPQTLTGKNPTYTFATPGTYTITLKVTDPEGNTATDTVIITVLDITKPTANAGSDRTVNEDTLITLDGSASTDNVAITAYTWTFTDVTVKTLTGAKPTYTFNTPGVYTITLNVTDAAGNWATDTVIITVLDVTKPIANAGQDQTVNVGATVTFDAGGSTDNVGVVSYEWDFGDGTTGIGKTTTHTYTTAGNYTVTLTVKDAAGNYATDSITITVLATEGTPMWIIGVAVAAVALAIAAAATIVWKKRK